MVYSIIEQIFALTFLFWPFITTVLIETVVYCIFMKISIEKRALKILVFSLLINSLTNPLANLIFYLSNSLFLLTTTTILVEVGVIAIETFLISNLLNVNYRKAVIISIVANVLSFLAGYFILFTF
jgi:hypothetical protein